jgi:hypothetical protein
MKIEFHARRNIVNGVPVPVRYETFTCENITAIEDIFEISGRCCWGKYCPAVPRDDPKRGRILQFLDDNAIRLYMGKFKVSKYEDFDLTNTTPIMYIPKNEWEYSNVIGVGIPALVIGIPVLDHIDVGGNYVDFITIDF